MGKLIFIREAVKDLGVNLNGASVAVQGYGNAGFWAAKILQDDFNCNIIAVSDSKGAIFNNDGIDAQAAADHKSQTRSVIGFNGTKQITNVELLELECDVLVPAALENVITNNSFLFFIFLLSKNRS